MVLVIDGDADYRAVIARCVELAGAEPEQVATVGQALRRLEGHRFDAIVWGLASSDTGQTEIVSQIQEAAHAPVVLLDESHEEARGVYEAGAAQLLPKPFVPGELVGAVKAALRGPGPASVVPLATRIEVGGVTFDSEARSISHGAGLITLSGREWELMSFLLANPNQFFAADDLLRQAWNSNRHSAEQLRSYVARLRRKLEPLGLPCDLVSRQGRGYSLYFPPAA